MRLLTAPLKAMRMQTALPKAMRKLTALLKAMRARVVLEAQRAVATPLLPRETRLALRPV